MSQTYFCFFCVYVKETYIFVLITVLSTYLNLPYDMSLAQYLFSFFLLFLIFDYARHVRKLIEMS